MLGNLNGWHAVILLVIILLLFGAPKLPALARSLGQSMKILKSEIKTPDADATSTPSDPAFTAGDSREVPLRDTAEPSDTPPTPKP